MKKGAMFGLESRALKKQFGKLFLVRMQSVGSQETRGARIQSNRAAMFGLDARIALAIFGALSVISGAALYSAIQDSRVTSYVVELEELSKAVTAYQLDTGELPPFGTVAYSAYMDLQGLLSSSVAGWSGPYISGVSYSTYNIEHKDFNYYGIRRMETTDWGNTSSNPCTNVSTSCGLYAVLANMPKDVADAIDKKVDGENNMTTGKVRVFDNTAFGGWAIFMHVRPYAYE